MEFGAGVVNGELKFSSVRMANIECGRGRVVDGVDLVVGSDQVGSSGISVKRRTSELEWLMATSASIQTPLDVDHLATTYAMHSQ